MYLLKGLAGVTLILRIKELNLSFKTTETTIKLFNI